MVSAASGLGSLDPSVGPYSLPPSILANARASLRSQG